MKRIVALLLAMVMVLGLVACGGGGGNGDTPNQAPTPTPSEPSEPGDTPPAEPGAFVPVTYEWDVLYDNVFGPFWEGLQDGLAAVDLDAQRRAQDTVDEARAEAEKIRADTQLWLDGVLEQYGQLRRGMDQLLEQARILGRTAEQVGSLDEAARALRELGGLERTEGT